MFVAEYFVCLQRLGNPYQMMAERHTPNILHCNEERHFWLSWYGGHVCLGHGKKKGENMIVSYQNLNPSPILAVSFSSSQVPGGWRIPLHSGRLIQARLLHPKASTTQPLFFIAAMNFTLIYSLGLTNQTLRKPSLNFPKLNFPRMLLELSKTIKGLI